MRETTSSLPRLTAAALSRALNLEQGSRLLTVRLPGAIDCEALRECFSLNGNGIPNICELEPGKQNTDSGDAAPVFIDATACVRKRFREINSACEALINDLEPGYLGFCDWEAYLWCLYALALSGRTRAAVLLPFESLDNAEQARAILLREGLVESVLYHPLAESPMHGMYALIVLSTGNRSVSFRNAATPMPRLRFADGARHPNLPLAFSPDWSGIECDSRKTVSIETIALETRKLLQHHAALSKGRVGLISVAQNYSATLGDSFMRVVPFMPRESTISNDIEAVEVRRISSQDFRNGNLLPRDVAENATEPDSEPVKVDPELLKRYELRPGDIIMPRMLGRYGASNLLVVGVDDAKQHLVASHNTTAIRPAIQTMTDEERTVYSEMVAAYLTSGHGAKIMQVLFENQLSRAIRPSDLFEIEVPPALDPRTREYSKSINHFAEVVRAKKQAEAAVAQAQRDLKAAKKAVTQVVDQACE
ncbi:hypothetical protein GT516_05815 [Collinsella sp. BIOML-A4]|uniref:hypothetical protein n=1 Tax=unclassified Collinsella TaxID=2637548 RepID=UPI00136DBFAE|nr:MULTISPECIES: hypothetical protein [unclassified Collinsella]MZJ33205.1 hypothetical protein [Collinsella sp. BIOML-A1]MZJ96998.1 hypothetical protein [Collinsella sp. BIOML-A6]MZJ27325.1 hypothetical protein [Collinsella sp. BIOML-A2]MZJ29392.1 hypothetical protein [Collinsella sp. BIOML-A3]MZK30800.1 hypothetical protein [Collinsella sp. BIOML-A5]